MIDKSVITKELVNEVLQWDEPISRIKIIGSYIRIFIEGRHNIPEQNIYEFAHKCKEWALKNKYNLLSYLSDRNDVYEAYVQVYSRDNFVTTIHGGTEPDAIIQACEWLLEQKKIEI